MSTQPPPDGPRDVGPPGYVEPAGSYQQPPPQGGHAGPWLLAAAAVIALGAILAVLIHNAGVEDTQTVITRSPTVSTTSVQPTVTQATTTVKPAPQTTTVTQPPKTTTVTQPARTVTAPTTTTTAP